MSLKEAAEQTAPAEEVVAAYKIHGVNVNVTPSEKKFVDDLFDSLASIPTGQNAIKDMQKYDVNFYLETALGSSGGYFNPENNQIVMAKSLGMDFMEFALVHEARHLWQNNQGRNEAEKQNLDYATRLMINRATEADAQTQAIQACKEWEAQGHDAPIRRFENTTSRLPTVLRKRRLCPKRSKAGTTMNESPRLMNWDTISIRLYNRCSASPTNALMFL